MTLTRDDTPVASLPDPRPGELPIDAIDPNPEQPREIAIIISRGCSGPPAAMLPGAPATRT